MLATALAVYVGRLGSPLAVSVLSTALFSSAMVFTPLWGALGDATGRQRVGVLVPIYLLAEVDVTPVAMGLLLTVSPIGQVVFVPIVGRLADAGPLRRVVLAGFLAIDAGFSALDIDVIAVVGRVVPRNRESAFLGLRATAGGLGGVIGPTLVGVGVVAVGYPAAFAAAGVVALIGAGLAAARSPDPPARPAGDTGPVPGPRIETAVGIPRPLGWSRPSLDEGDQD